MSTDIPLTHPVADRTMPQLGNEDDSDSSNFSDMCYDTASDESDFDEERRKEKIVCRWAGCDATLPTRPSLVSHLVEVHIGVRQPKYTCEWSGCTRMGILQPSRFALVSHMRSHTGEKPFYCIIPECNKNFTRSDALAKHMRTVHEANPNKSVDSLPWWHQEGICTIYGVGKNYKLTKHTHSHILKNEPIIISPDTLPDLSSVAPSARKYRSQLDQPRPEKEEIETQKEGTQKHANSNNNKTNGHSKKTESKTNDSIENKSDPEIDNLQSLDELKDKLGHLKRKLLWELELENELSGDLSKLTEKKRRLWCKKEQLFDMLLKKELGDDSQSLMSDT